MAAGYKCIGGRRKRLYEPIRAAARCFINRVKKLIDNITCPVV